MTFRVTLFYSTGFMGKGMTKLKPKRQVNCIVKNSYITT